MDEADRLRVQLELTPRDSHSHCEACTRSQIAGFFADTGRDEDALRLVGEMIEGGLTCAEEPEHALSRVLLPYLRAGRHAEAKSAHLRSYRLAKDDPDSLGIVAGNIVFTAVTGNEARALAMVERHLPWLGHDGLNDAAHFRALCAFGLALDAVTRAGHGDAVVRGADAPALVRFVGEHDGEWTAAELATAAWRGADTLAAAFDTRNGSDTFAAFAAATRALADERYDVPIRADVFAAPISVAPAGTPEERAERAFALADWGDVDAALTAARAALADGDHAFESRLRSLVVSALAANEDWTTAEAELPARIAALRAGGETEQADVEAELGLAMYGQLSEEGMAALEAAASDETHSPAVLAELYSALAGVGVRIDDMPAAISLAGEAATFFQTAGRPDRAAAALAFTAAMQFAASDTGTLDTVSRVLEMPEATDGTRARALQLRARLAQHAEAFDEGAADADEATRLATRMGASVGMADLSALAAVLHEGAGDAEGAVARFRIAVQAAEREQAPERLTVRYRLGSALLAAGEAAEAADVLVELLNDEGDAGTAASSRGHTAATLAQAYEADGQTMSAARAWDFAASLFDHGSLRVQRAHALTALGANLGRLGEHEDAAAALQEAIVIARAHPEERALLLRAVHLHGQSATLDDDPEAMPLLDEALRIATELGDDWAIADVTDSRARALARTEDVDAAVATALQAADAYARAGDQPTGARSELFAARVLVGAGRGADSVPLYRDALEHTDDATLRQVAAIEFGDVLAALGRHAEAAEVRAIADA